ncbi:hypothetical protein HDU92_001881 [Lobulomyces angularis]|nr:hypothetical protein HDU92_001881 [Lobulomyces angularis]
MKKDTTPPLTSKPKKNNAAYADRNNLFQICHEMLSAVLISKPDDVITFFIEHLKTAKVPAFSILGPPASNLKYLAEKVAKAHDAIYISATELLINAISRGNSYGTQAKPFVERRQLVPDAIMTAIVLARLKDPDVQSNGFVLQGYPRTREQACSLQRAGIILSHVVVIDIPDDLVVERASGLRLDPQNNKTYHLKYDPPPKTPNTGQRLIQRASDTEDSVRSRLKLYRRNITLVSNCYKDNLRKFTYENGYFKQEDLVLKELLKVFGQGLNKIDYVPREFKILVQGLPGSGKSFVCEKLHEKYGIIHVSPKLVVLEELSSNSKNEFPDNQKNNNRFEDVPKDVVLKLIVQKLKSKQCTEKGWVLENFPNSFSEAEALKKEGILPNRFFWLEVDKETCLKRLTNRFYDATNGKVFHTVTNLNLQIEQLPTLPNQNLIKNPQDSELKVKKRLEESEFLKEELLKSFGYKMDEKSKGIMQEINAVGLSVESFKESIDKDGFYDEEFIERSKEKTFEFLEGNLLRPIPVVSRIA